jgi:hypothetical protein
MLVRSGMGWDPRRAGEGKGRLDGPNGTRSARCVIILLRTILFQSILKLEHHRRQGDTSSHRKIIQGGQWASQHLVGRARERKGDVYLYREEQLHRPQSLQSRYLDWYVLRSLDGSMRIFIITRLFLALLIKSNITIAIYTRVGPITTIEKEN